MPSGNMTDREQESRQPWDFDLVLCPNRATVLRLLAAGATEPEILSDYRDLETEDIRECLRFAAASAMERELPLPYSA